jgi:hypothetical protein
MWDLLYVSGKGEARAAMEAADSATVVKAAKQSKALVKERTSAMGVGIWAYRHGAYFPVLFLRWYMLRGEV